MGCARAGGSPGLRGFDIAGAGPEPVKRWLVAPSDRASAARGRDDAPAVHDLDLIAGHPEHVAPPAPGDRRLVASVVLDDLTTTTAMPMITSRTNRNVRILYTC